MSEMQQQVLASALARSQKEIQAEIGGTWCDALPCLLVTEWPRARKHLLTPHPQSTSVVVQAWMQVGYPAAYDCGRPNTRGTGHSCRSCPTSTCKCTHDSGVFCDGQTSSCQVLTLGALYLEKGKDSSHQSHEAKFHTCVQACRIGKIAQRV